MLLSFDVVGLYPKIPHQEGIHFMKGFLNERSDKSIDKKTLCRLAKIVLKEN